MITNEILIDSFERISETLHMVVEGLSDKELTFRPTDDANSIAWLAWHLTRVQDDHMADLMGTKQLWHTTYAKRFKLPFKDTDTGYGHTSEDVASVKVPAEELLAYYDAVHKKTIAYVSKLKLKDYEKIVDTRWDPPVTQAVRLVSIINDDTQHVGQAAYIKGLLNK